MTDIIPGITSPAGSDLSVTLLSQLLGDQWWTLQSGSTNLGLLGDMFASFNVALMVFVGLLLAYQATLGAMQTAHEGVTLGKRYHSIYAPVRAPLSLVLLTPLPIIKGLTVLQASILMAVYGSIGMADMPWTAFTKYLSTAPATFYQAQVSPQNVDQSATNMLQIALLTKSVMAVNPKLNLSFDGTQASNWTWDTSANGAHATGTLHVMQNGSPNDDFGTVQITCGVMPTTTLGELGDWFSNMAAKASNWVTNQKPSTAAVESSLCKAQENAIGALVITANGYADQFVTDIQKGTKLDDTVKSQMGSTYALMLGNIVDSASGYGAGKASDLVTTTQNFANQSAAMGWASSAVFYPALTAMVGDYQELIATLNPTVTPSPVPNQVLSAVALPPDSTTLQVPTTDLRPYLDGMQALLQMGSLKSIAASGNSSGEAGLDQMMEGTFSSHLMNYAKGLADGGNIIVFLSMQGQDAIEWGTGMVAGGAVAGAVGSVAKKIPVVGDAFKSLGSLLVLVGSLLVIEGAILSYVLPFIPAVIMAMAIVGWLLLVVELMVAAPIFAAAHAFADGEGVTGQRTQHGYAVILGTLLRPTLLTFGFVFSFLLFAVGGKVLGIVFYAGFSSFAVTGVGPVQLVTYLGVMLSAAVAMIYFIAKLITHLAEHIPQYLGGRGSDLGVDHAATGAMKQAEGHGKAAAGAAVGYGAKSLQSLAEEAGKFGGKGKGSTTPGKDAGGGDGDGPAGPAAPPSTDLQEKDDANNKGNTMSDPAGGDVAAAGGVASEQGGEMSAGASAADPASGSIQAGGAGGEQSGEMSAGASANAPAVGTAASSETGSGQMSPGSSGGSSSGSASAPVAGTNSPPPTQSGGSSGGRLFTPADGSSNASGGHEPPNPGKLG